jgi:hypothetical protein
MMKSRFPKLVILLVGFVFVPLVIDRWIAHRDYLKYAREDELVARFECEPPTKCIVDFNSDTVPAQFEVSLAEAVSGSLLVFDGGREILRLPYDHTDGTLRTHMAIRNESGQPRLLTYDGASQQPPQSGAYAWNGDKLVLVSPTAIDREIISAMAGHDDSGGWNERALFRPVKRMALLVGYYFVLAFVVGIVLFKRRRSVPIAAPSNNRLQPTPR